jgi:hypothetical protein
VNNTRCTTVTYIVVHRKAVNADAARQVLVMCTSLWKPQADDNKFLSIYEMEIVLMHTEFELRGL